MSRIGKLPINIPEGTEVQIAGRTITAKGKEGELSYTFDKLIDVKKEDKVVIVSLNKKTKESQKLYGLSRTLVYNVIKGVSEGFEKRLSIHGVGYRAAVEDNNLTLNVGFSHPVVKTIPQGLDVKIEKNFIIISGANKETVGQFAADIRKIKKPEPYKGKGIRYIDERVRRKAGKTAK
ncbi:MAG: 50S ribosomal protein L6 [Patescibacteria group bacterium]|nr:50S ribosomal protein L6 [Patescibacteria group bacterium]MCL5093968.1 50S ribosomal protein L6 [Patescibacteria group bacterium]